MFKNRHLSVLVTALFDIRFSNNRLAIKILAYRLRMTKVFLSIKMVHKCNILTIKITEYTKQKTKAR